MKRILLLLCVLGFALPAWAETCLSNGSFVMTDATTATMWTGCTPGATDDFRIRTDDIVQIDPAVALTTGSIGMDVSDLACGTLIIPPGSRLTYGDGTEGTDIPGGLYMECGTLIADGLVRKVGRVVDVTESNADTAAGAGTVTLTTDVDMTGVSTTTDWLRFTDEDPDNAASQLSGSVWSGPGVAPAGVHRPTFNKWAWGDLTAVSGKTVTYQLSSEETFSGTPYRGTRDWPTGTSDPLSTDDTGEVVSMTRQWGGFSTAIRVSSSYAEMCKMEGDLGSFYGIYEETRPFSAALSALSALSLTAADAATVDIVYGSEESGVINNIRVRVGEMATQLAAAITSLNTTLGTLNATLRGSDRTMCGGQAYKVLHCERGAPNFDFLDGDVSVANNTITEAAHTYAPGDLIRFTATVTLPAGLALSTDYFAVISDANTILVATTEALAAAGQNAIDAGGTCGIVGAGGSCVDITGAASGGTHTSNGRVSSLATNTQDDVVWFAGDMTECTTGDMHLTHGVRRGDPFEIVLPATIDGDGGTDDGNPEGAIVFLGGTLKINRTRFVDVGFNSTGDISPAAPNNYNILFAQGGSTGATTVPSGYIRNSQVWHPESDTTDTGTMLFAGSTAAVMRFPSDGSPNFSGLTLDRIHVTDAYNQGTRAGTHGYLAMAVRNLNPTRWRIERQSDDGVAGLMYDPTIGCTGTADDPQRCSLGQHVRQFLAYENIAGGDNSQECLSFAVAPNGSTNATSTTAITSGSLRVTDMVGIGCYEAALSTTGGGIVLNRSVFSSNSFGASTRLELSIGGPEITTNYLMDTYGNQIRNSVLSSMGRSGTDNNLSLVGGLYDSVLFGANQHKNNAGSLFYTGRFSGSVIDLDANSGELLLRGAAANPATPPNLMIDNSVFRLTGGSATVLCYEYKADQTITLSRMFMALGNYQIGGSPDGPLRLCSTTTGAVTTIDGLTVTTTAASGNGILQWNATGSSVENVCFESAFDNQAANEAFTTACPTCLNSQGLVPEADDDTGLRAFLADPDSETVCGNYAKPERLGFREFGVAHAMLGDGVIQQYRLWTSDDLIRPTFGGDGGGGGGGNGPSYW